MSARPTASVAAKRVGTLARTERMRPTQAEATAVHTRLQKLALGIDESRDYWSHVDPTEPPAARALRAFGERWFGARSLERIRTLLPNLAARYDAFPNALSVLRRWTSMEPDTRRVVCHWHLQLSDPLYRSFTGDFLPARRAITTATTTLDRDAALRWLRGQYGARWGEATLIQFASKLLSACSEAALVSPAPDPRTLTLPRVSDDALAYLLHLLREVRFAGSLVDNPYLRSVGLDEAILDHRLRPPAAVILRRAGNVWELEWRHESLLHWGETLR